ncbi:MAG: hypothetical protein FRX48_03485 [Lasallia pustulata]|uniref:DUF7137 domain-containing protein n=1 Tax=Lasallia pustulata TaxID=136370 RepID=A0A5M8PST5_9LECA|nr:MAG: hypothetical protein FRX48_03485 [Lasallia pustulata]
MRTIQLVPLLSAIFLFSTLSTAWPWPPSIGDIEEMIVRRENEGSSSASAGSTAAASNTASGTTESRASGSGSAAATSGKKSTANSGGTDSKATGTSNVTESSSAPTSIDPRLPPGGIQMVTPAPTAAAQYYKIGDHVTFAWNYTSLSVTPSYIDVVASCRSNSEAYTIAANMSVAPTGAVTWDTSLDATGVAPLLTDQYTLVIYDAAKGISSTPSAGYLSTFQQFSFGMYIPQPYTPLNDYICATCSGALSDTERQTLKFLFGMGTITVLSFTWFAGGFGVF